MGLISLIDMTLFIISLMNINGTDGRTCSKSRWRGVTEFFGSKGSKISSQKIPSLVKLSNSKYTEAYLVIDNHLRSKTLSADLNRNLDEILRQRVRESGKYRDWTRLRIKSGLSEQLCDSALTQMDMIASMDKLLTLRHRNTTEMCTIDGVKNLSNNDKIALNPIEQHAKNKPYLLARIGAMIANTAVDATPVCLKLLTQELSRLLYQRFLPDPEWVVLRDHCEGILAFYLDKNGRPFDGAFQVDRAQDTVDLIKGLSNKLDDQEIMIGLETSIKQEQQSHHQKQQAREMSTVRRKGSARSKMEFFQEYMMEPCEKYKYNVDHLFRGIELYLPLANSLSDDWLNSTVYNKDVTRLWTMYLICERIRSLRNDVGKKLDELLI